MGCILFFCWGVAWQDRPPPCVLFLVEGTDESKSLNGVHYFIFVEGEDFLVTFLLLAIGKGGGVWCCKKKCILILWRGTWYYYDCLAWFGVTFYFFVEGVGIGKRWMVLHFYCTNVIQVLLGNAGGVALQFLSRGTISQSPIQQELDGFAFYVCQYNNQPGWIIWYYNQHGEL